MANGSVPTAQSSSTSQLDEVRSDRRKALGFEPGIPLHSIERVPFDLDHVKDALFGSTYQAPIIVIFRDEREVMCEEPIGHGLPMVIELMQAVYVPAEPHAGSGIYGCHPEPDWYVRGFLYKSGFDPYSEVIRMHVYLEIDARPGTPAKIERTDVQVVRKPSTTDSAEPLMYAADPAD